MGNQRFWEHEIETDLVLEKFYRYLGFKVAGAIKTMPISPNQITLSRIALGAGVFYLLAFTEKLLLGSALIVLWKIADKTDGALARITGKETKFGTWLDTLMDRVFWGLTLLGLTIAVYKDTHNALPWLLLFAIVFGHTLFQNFTFLTTGEHPIVNWSKRRKSLQHTVHRRLKTTILYQTVFSIYYLSDQVVAAALLLNSPVKNAVGLNTLLLTLLLFALFFAAAFSYVIYNQYKMLTSEVRNQTQANKNSMATQAAEQYQRVRTKRQYIDFYKKKAHAEDYACRDLKGASPLFTQVETQVVMKLAKRYLSPRKSRLLDVATGGGRIVKVLENHFGESIAVDTSARMLEIARKRTNKTLLKLADIENLPLDNNTVDCITGFRLLINIPRKNRHKMLTELRRVLKDKGILAMNVHLNTLSPRGIRDIIVKARSPKKMISYFGIKQELKQTGFKVIHVQGVNMLVLYNLLPFIPHAALVKIDKFTGGLPPIAYVSDTFIVFAQKTSLDRTRNR